MSGFLRLETGKMMAKASVVGRKNSSAGHANMSGLEAENHLTKEVDLRLSIFLKCAAIGASFEIMVANLNEFRWDGEEMAILSEMFKQTAQQLVKRRARKRRETR